MDEKMHGDATLSYNSWAIESLREYPELEVNHRNYIAGYEAGYLAAQANHDAEISELVEALYKIAYDWRYGSRTCETDNIYAVANMGKIAEKAVDRYTKTPCPACDGKGRVPNPKRGVSGVNGKPFPSDCPTCQGRGYKWER